MPRTVPFVVVLLTCLTGPAAWCLTESQQQGMDELLAQTVVSLTGGEPALWNLMSSQGSTVVMVTPDGYIAAGRGKLKSDTELAAGFRLPEELRVDERSLRRAGMFVLGEATLSAPAPLPPAPPWSVPEGPPLMDLLTAFTRPESRFYVRPPEPEPPGPEPVLAELPRTRWQAHLAAVQDGPQRSWRYVSLTITPMPSEAAEVGEATALEVIRSWEQMFMQGDTSMVTSHLNPDPFCVAADTPDGQSWFFTYPEYLTAMLGSALAMGVADKSEMRDVRAYEWGQVAVADGQWRVAIAALGNLAWDMTATLVKPADKWMLVSLCAGMLEG